MENGLVVRQVPQIRKLIYDAHSTDYMVYKRPRRSVNNTGDSGAALDEATKRAALHDYQKAMQF